MPSKVSNVLFVICHDIGRRYGCYGNPQILTPNLDRLARESVQFDNHFCQWPLCGPSRANIFSGCRPLTTERYAFEPFFPEFRKKMAPGFQSLPELFKAHGYQALATGLIYHDVNDPDSWSRPEWEPPAANDMPDWAAGWLATNEVTRYRLPESRELIRQRLETLQADGYQRADFKMDAVRRKVQGPAVEGCEGEDEIYYDGKVNRKAVEYLEQMDGQTPFFLAVGFVNAHTPFMAPKKYWDLYDRSQLRLPENQDDPEGSPEWASGDSEPAQLYTSNGYEKPWRASREQSLELLHGRYAAISYFDAQVGKLVEALRRRGVYDDTLIVVTSDHGFHEAEHGYWGKHNLWDVSLQVPLLMRIPGMIEKGVRISALTEHVDIFPTLCELRGLPVPGYVEGDSLVPLIRQPERPWKRAVFAHRKHMWHDRIQAYAFAHSVRTHTHRLNVYLDDRGARLYTELFDYVKDPLETTNVAGDPAHASVMRELSEWLKAGWQSCRPGHHA
ncbi:MAG: sulfatase [Kiritimatiellia bacterium]|nr:sulfatase [Lentisphaerota bacterium]